MKHTSNVIIFCWIFQVLVYSITFWSFVYKFQVLVTMATQEVSTTPTITRLPYIPTPIPNLHHYPHELTYIITTTTQGHSPCHQFSRLLCTISLWSYKPGTSKGHHCSSTNQCHNSHKSVVTRVTYQTLSLHRWPGPHGKDQWCHHLIKGIHVEQTIDPSRDQWTLQEECGRFYINHLYVYDKHLS